MSAWYDNKSVGNQLTPQEWNDHTLDQLTRPRIQPYSYLIFTDGNYFYSQNGNTGYINTETNFSTALQKAIDDCYNINNGKIHLKSGLYPISQSINIKSGKGGQYGGLTIEGEGPANTMLQLNQGLNIPIFTSQWNAFLELDNFSIDGNQTNPLSNTSIDGIYLKESYESKFNRLRIINCYRGMWIDSGNMNNITNSTITYNRHIGIGGNIVDSTIRNNYIGVNGSPTQSPITPGAGLSNPTLGGYSSGISLNNYGEVSILDNLIWGNFVGIYAFYGSLSRISHNIIDGHDRNAILIHGSINNSSISDNTIIESSMSNPNNYDDIYLQIVMDTKNNKINDNIFGTGRNNIKPRYNINEEILYSGNPIIKNMYANNTMIDDFTLSSINLAPTSLSITNNNLI